MQKICLHIVFHFRTPVVQSNLKMNIKYNSHTFTTETVFQLSNFVWTLFLSPNNHHVITELA